MNREFTAPISARGEACAASGAAERTERTESASTTIDFRTCGMAHLGEWESDRTAGKRLYALPVIPDRLPPLAGATVGSTASAPRTPSSHSPGAASARATRRGRA